MPKTSRILIPTDIDNATLSVGGREVRLTNLRKLFWPALEITKGALIQYYVDVAPVLLPHIRDRAMVMKRYPHGAGGPFFFMKRAPVPRPAWIRTCAIDHGSRSAGTPSRRSSLSTGTPSRRSSLSTGTPSRRSSPSTGTPSRRSSENIIDFPVIDDVAALMWVINLGCIDLNQWYATCDDVDRPDYLHVDLDPGEGATFDQVRESAVIIQEALETLGMKPLAKTSGSKGIHVYVPIVRGPEQKVVWTFAKALAMELASRYPKLMTAEYRVAKRPRGRVLVDYNQNRWGSTLASIYSVRPRPQATVSTPVTWKEVRSGVRIEDFRLDNVRDRIAKVGDLWKPLLASRGRANLGMFMKV